MTLTQLWAITPRPLLRRLSAVLGISDGNCHDWLCPALGCIHEVEALPVLAAA